MTDSGTTGPGVVLALILATLCSANVMATMDLFIVNVPCTASASVFGVRCSQTSLGCSAHTRSCSAPCWCQPVVRRPLRHEEQLPHRPVAVHGGEPVCAVSPKPVVIGRVPLRAAAGGRSCPGQPRADPASPFPATGFCGAVRIWTVSSAISGAIGPVLGGLLNAASWRWIFVVNLPIGIATVIAAAAGCRTSSTIGDPHPRPESEACSDSSASELSHSGSEGDRTGDGRRQSHRLLAGRRAGIGLSLLSTPARQGPSRRTSPCSRAGSFSARTSPSSSSPAVLAIQLLGMSLLLEAVVALVDGATGLGIAPDQ